MNAQRMSFSVPALLCLVLFTGCVPKQAPEAPVVLPDARAAYRYAVETYQTGEYDAAAKLFGEISDTSADPVVARQAFFGLTLARLAGADTQAGFDAAMDLWRTWYALAPADPAWEDPRLFAQFLDRLRPGTVEKALAPKPVAKAVADCSGPLNKLAAARQENAMLKDRLKELALENERLRGQLTALEALHQEILIKKKGFD